MMSGAAAQRVLQITDTHLLADPAAELSGADVEARFQATLAAMRPWAAQADALLHTGDLVHDGSTTGYQRLREALASLGLPGRVVPGNHDDRAAMAAVFSEGLVRAEPTLTLGNWLVVCLDSLSDGAVEGRLSEADLAVLDQALSQSSAAHVLLALHHPPLAVGTTWLDAIGLHEPEALWARLDAEPRLRGVCFGHIHHAFEGERNGLPMLATPASAAQFLAGAETFTLDVAPPAFRWLDLHANGAISTDVVTLPESV